MIVTYKLKQDLIIPATGNPSRGYLLFPKEEFGLSYQVNPNSRKKILSVVLCVADINTNEIIWPLTIYEITEKGFPTSQYQNQSEIDLHNRTKNAIEESISILSSDIAAKEEEIKYYTESDLEVLQNLITDLNTLKTSRDNAINELSNLVAPEPVPIYINKYDDVIGYFKGDGSLTEEGVQWARSVYYNGILIGDLIE